MDASTSTCPALMQSTKPRARCGLAGTKSASTTSHASGAAKCLRMRESESVIGSIHSSMSTLSYEDRPLRSSFKFR